MCAFVFYQMWEDLIQKAKDGGLDVIDTYVFWNAHEPSPGNVSELCTSTCWIFFRGIFVFSFTKDYVLSFCSMFVYNYSGMRCFSIILREDTTSYGSSRKCRKWDFMPISVLDPMSVQNGISGIFAFLLSI